MNFTFLLKSSMPKSDSISKAHVSPATTYFQVDLGLPQPLLTLSTNKFSHLRIEIWGLLNTCPNHLSLHFLTFHWPPPCEKVENVHFGLRGSSALRRGEKNLLWKWVINIIADKSKICADSKPFFNRSRTPISKLIGNVFMECLQIDKTRIWHQSW